MNHLADMKLLSVIVIGLNEEERLAFALQSAIIDCPAGFALEVIYVDSGSKDRSVEIAAKTPGVEVVHLNDPYPSAAKARNAGLKRVRGEYVQLLDGDSVLQSGWLPASVNFLDQHPDIACVFGHCIEMHPESSIYMRVCGFDWHIASGEYRLCGGNAMWRRSVIERAGFFDESLRLGEEPDLCYRVRQQGGRIYCIDLPMVMHDLGMTSFTQYWRRALNSGKAYARVAQRYWRNPEKLWAYEVLRNFAEPALWLAVFLLGAWTAGPWIGLAALLCWWVLRGTMTAIKVHKRARNWPDAFLYGLHVQFTRLPMAIGQFRALAAKQ
jgi:GT2 family glycosyltransferase